MQMAINVMHRHAGAACPLAHGHTGVAYRRTRVVAAAGSNGAASSNGAGSRLSG